MKRTIAAIALALLPAGTLADMIFEHAGHTYKLIENPATWYEANAIAERMTLGGQSGYLARVDSAAENTAILDALLGRLTEEQLRASVPNDDSGAAFVWLGGSDADAEGNWVWSNNGDAFWSGDFNGSPVAGRYNNWGVQPDDATGHEDALAIGLADWPDPFFDLGASGQWNDLDPENRLLYVVEFDQVVQPMQMNLDEPLNTSTQTGVGMIRGWVVAEEDIARIEVYLDGEYAFDIPYGDPRPDIAAKFSDSDTAANSGFSVPFRFTALSPGQHTLDVVAVDRFGNRTKRSSQFDVIRFHKGYIGINDLPNMAWANAGAVGDQIIVRGVEIAGIGYNIILEWQVRSQKFEIVEIFRLSP